MKAEPTPRDQLRTPDLFICYSRKDRDFVEALRDALVENQRQPWVDLEGIPPTAEWRNEVRANIEAAHAFAFVISPDSLTSPECSEELSHAIRHHKRLLPVLRRRVGDTSLPEALAKLQWLDFLERDEFSSGFQALLQAMDTDLDWVRAHTRLLNSAIWWDSKGRDTSHLYRGMDLQDAVQWLARAEGKEPAPTTLQIDYVQASRVWEAQEIQRLHQLYNRALARQLAVQAELARIQPHSSPAHSALLAVESLERLPTSEANLTLRQALSVMPVVQCEIAHDAPVVLVAFSPDGKTLATATANGLARLFDASTFSESGRIAHGAHLRAMRFSPDSRFLATASDNTARISRVPAGDEVVSVVHEGVVYDLAFSADSRILASCGWDGTARLTDTSTAMETRRVQHGNQITRVAFSPDGRLIATASWDRSARITDVATGDPVASIQHRRDVNTLAVNPNGRSIATSAREATLRISSMRTGRKLADIDYELPVVAAVFSPDGTRVATTIHENTVCISDIASRKEGARVKHRDMVFGVSFSSDGRLLGTTSRDGIARISLTSTGAELKRVKHDDTVFDLAFDADARRFATAGHDNVVRVCGLQPDTHEVVIVNPGPAAGVVFLPDGRRIATVPLDGRVCIFDVVTGARIARLKGRRSNRRWPLPVTIVSPDTKLVASSGTRGVSIFDLDGFTRRHRLNLEWPVKGAVFNGRGRALALVTLAPDNPPRYSLHIIDLGRRTGPRIDIQSDVRAMAFSPHDRWFVYATWDGHVRVIDAATGAEIRSFGQRSQVSALRFSPDGQVIAVAVETGSVQVVDGITGETRVEIRQDRLCTKLLFSPDGQTMALVTFKGTVGLYNATSGTETGRIRHDDDVHHAAFSPDGLLIATASGDHVALVCDARSGREVARIIHADAVLSVAFSPDGRLVATTSRDGTTRIVAFRNDDLIREARTRLTRHFTVSEWKRYLPDEDFKPAFLIGAPREPGAG